MRRTAVVAAVYAAVALTVWPVFPHFVSPNEFSRWLLGASIVEHATVEVSALAPMFGERFEDLSSRDGRLYSNKAPAAALLGVPGYAAARAVAGPPDGSNLRVTLTAMRLVASTLPLILLALGMSVLARRMGADEESRTFGTFVLLFATPLFSYGLLYFAHAFAAAALFGAWAMLFAVAERRPFHDLAAGGLLGLAVGSEYPLAITIPLVAALLVWERRYGSLARMIGGGIPFALALAAYNTAAFGGPLEFSSGYERLEEFRALAGSGLFGIGLPSPAAVFGMLAGARKGLFLLSPILLFGVAAFPAARRALSKQAFAGIVALPAAILLIYSGYPNWHGGWAVGPRYLAGAIPFLVFPLFLRGSGLLACGVAGFSAAAIVIASLTFPFPPEGFPLPWATFAFPLLTEGLVAPNLFHLISHQAGVTVPFVIVAIAMIACGSRRGWIGVVGGAGVAVAVAMIVMLARTPSLPERLQLAYVEEVYFEKGGALRLGIPLPARLIARRDFELRLPPGSWRF